jgi:Major intrinsic protein
MCIASLGSEQLHRLMSNDACTRPEQFAVLGTGMISRMTSATVYATKPVSGGHLNPALTLATAISGHMHWVRTAVCTLSWSRLVVMYMRCFILVSGVSSEAHARLPVRTRHHQ